MLPLIPALLLLLLSPATAERLAREGRFPPRLTVAMRVAQASPVRAAWSLRVFLPPGAPTRARRERATIPPTLPGETPDGAGETSRDRDGPAAR